MSSDYHYGIEKGFAPDVPVIVEEGELSEEPLYNSVLEALEIQRDTLYAQTETGPKVAKRRTHQFSNGETFTYTVYQGVLFEGDVVLGTYKQFLDEVVAYEKEIERRRSSGEITAQGAFYKGYCLPGNQSLFWCARYGGLPWEGSTLWVDRNSIINNFTSAQQNAIFSALNYIDSNTDVIVNYGRTGTTNGQVVFTKAGSGCFAELGQQWKYGQVINLSDACFPPDNRSAVHEIGHALGMIHEHQRPDRNSYITINTANLTQKGKDNLSTTYGVSSQTSYDYYSVMHYRQFTTDPGFVLNTSQPLFNTTSRFTGNSSDIGGSRLTASDIAAINARY